MKYAIYVTQDGFGCGYLIDCGKTLIALKKKFGG